MKEFWVSFQPSNTNGSLAQLVERYLDKVDVGSSSLPRTTI